MNNKKEFQRQMKSSVISDDVLREILGGGRPISSTFNNLRKWLHRTVSGEALKARQTIAFNV